MKKGMNPGGINTGNPLERTLCPFSPERLYELYWHEGLSTPEIAKIAAGIIGCRMSHTAVEYWLNKASISRRSRSQANRNTMQKHPDYKAKAAQHLKSVRQVGQPQCKSPDYMRKLARKGTAAHKKYSRARRITKPCSYPPCAKLIEGPPSRFKSRHSYCSLHCCMKHRRFLEKCYALEHFKVKQSEHYHTEMRRLAQEVLGIDLPQHPPES